jgi:hypothetical protein
MGRGGVKPSLTQQQEQGQTVCPRLRGVSSGECRPDGAIRQHLHARFENFPGRARPVGKSGRRIFLFERRFSAPTGGGAGGLLIASSVSTTTTKTR